MKKYLFVLFVLALAVILVACGPVASGGVNNIQSSSATPTIPEVTPIAILRGEYSNRELYKYVDGKITCYVASVLNGVGVTTISCVQNP